MTIDTKSKVGRPKTPKDLADRLALNRIAALASDILVCLSKPGRGVYDSERQLRQWLQEDGIQHSTSDIAHALTLLESTGKIARAKVKQNAPRPGWLVTAAEKAAERGLNVNGNGASTAIDATAEERTEPVTPEPAEDAVEPAEDVLARAIIKSFSVSGRGFNGNRTICESEFVLREWLSSDGVTYRESDLGPALARLETASLPGSSTRLLRGSSLHRTYPIFQKPLPPRAMELTELHPFDRLMYEPSDLEPYVLAPKEVAATAEPDKATVRFLS